MNDLLDKHDGYLISFDSTGKNLVMKCSEHGVFYDGEKPMNHVGRRNLLRAQSQRHRNDFHASEVDDGQRQPS